MPAVHLAKGQLSPISHPLTKCIILRWWLFIWGGSGTLLRIQENDGYSPLRKGPFFKDLYFLVSFQMVCGILEVYLLTVGGHELLIIFSAQSPLLYRPCF